MAVRAFISYDYDNDFFLKEAIVGQSRNADSPFTISDYSIKVASAGWKEEARRRISASGVVIVMCGKQTHTAVGVDYEVQLAQQLGKPYFLLAGYAEGVNKKPLAAKDSDKMYRWTWENLKTLIHGGR